MRFTGSTVNLNVVSFAENEIKVRIPVSKSGPSVRHFKVINPGNKESNTWPVFFRKAGDLYVSNVIIEGQPSPGVSIMRGMPLQTAGFFQNVNVTLQGGNFTGSLVVKITAIDPANQNLIHRIYNATITDGNRLRFTLPGAAAGAGIQVSNNAGNYSFKVYRRLINGSLVSPSNTIWITVTGPPQATPTPTSEPSPSPESSPSPEPSPEPSPTESIEPFPTESPEPSPTPMPLPMSVPTQSQMIEEINNRPVA